MFRKYHRGRRPTNILFVIFRLILSVVMFVLLLGGVYSAYKHFSGVDPLKLDPQAVATNLLQAKTPQQFLGILSSLKVNEKILGQSQQPNQKVAEKIKFKFLLIADSHTDIIDLKKALNQAKRDYPDLKFIIGLGDYSDVGTVNELNNAKIELDNSGLRYFLIPGDHDLWDSRDKQVDPATSFKTVFGPSFQSFTYDNFTFILLYNSDNYLGLGEEQIKWLTEELEKAKEVQGVFVFTHEPLYHPSSDHVMGRVEKSLKQQAKSLIYQLKDKGVKKVFAGDTHYFSEYTEPETKLPMVTVGAVTIERNPQTPRFAIGYVFEDGTIQVMDVEIK